MTLVAAGAILFFVLGRSRAPLEAGTEAPPLEVVTNEGPARLEGEGVTVVNFWSMYCPPCREEAPVLARAHARLRNDGGRVLGLATDSAPLGDVVAAAERFGMDYPIAVAPGAIVERWSVDRLPTTYVVSPAGRIVEAFVGFAVSDEELRRAIDAASR